MLGSPGSVTCPPPWRSSPPCRAVLCLRVTSRARSRALLEDLGQLRWHLRQRLPGHGQRTVRRPGADQVGAPRSEEHTSELQSRQYLVCRLLLEKKTPSTEEFSSYLGLSLASFISSSHY